MVQREVFDVCKNRYSKKSDDETENNKDFSFEKYPWFLFKNFNFTVLTVFYKCVQEMPFE